jgi:hypothetical protein
LNYFLLATETFKNSTPGAALFFIGLASGKKDISKTILHVLPQIENTPSRLLPTHCFQTFLVMLPAAMAHQHHKVDHQWYTLKERETQQLEQLIGTIYFIQHV